MQRSGFVSALGPALYVRSSLSLSLPFPVSLLSWYRKSWNAKDRAEERVGNKTKDFNHCLESRFNMLWRSLIMRLQIIMPRHINYGCCQTVTRPNWKLLTNFFQIGQKWRTKKTNTKRTTKVAPRRVVNGELWGGGRRGSSRTQRAWWQQCPKATQITFPACLP